MNSIKRNSVKTLSEKGFSRMPKASRVFLARPALFCLLVACLALWGCDSKDEAGAPQMLPYVKVFDTEAVNIPWPAEYQATAAGSRAVEVRARVQGIVQERLYKEGSYVKAGQLMFQIERDQYEAAYQEAQAAFMNAEREWNRIRPLYKANAVSQRDRDTALSNYDSTRAALRQAKINLDYCQVEAPVSGYSSKETVTVGNLVANNSLLTTVNQTDPMYIDFSIAAPERLYRMQLEREGRLKTPEMGMYEARLRLLDGRMYDKIGVIDFIDSQVQPTTGVISARAIFPNADNTIMPGQYVRVYMDGDILVNAVLIPQSAVSVTEEGTFVMVVGEGDIVHRIPVKVGTAIGDKYLVDEGLKGGERIIMDGILKAREGAPVRYDDPKAPPADNAAGPSGENAGQNAQ